ncbi:MAG: SPOR domain-containing protein [Halioglobus sp.]|nr:SPOR domain-containing protein [Halioglobus sp.]
MNEVLKQRLVGALILLALGVIFWPIIFVQPESVDSASARTFPPKPEVPALPLEPPDSAGLRASEPIDVHGLSDAVEPAEPLYEPDTVTDSEPPASAALSVSAPEEAVPARTETPEELVLDGDGIPVAWILQVASVSDADKAEALRQRLLSMDQKAYVQKVSSGGRTYHRVYIGPKFEKARLEALRADIDAEFGVTSMLRRYVP